MQFRKFQMTYQSTIFKNIKFTYNFLSFIDPAVDFNYQISPIICN